MSGGICGSLGRRFGTFGGNFSAGFESFWWSGAGYFGDPGLPRASQGGRVEKVAEKVVRGSFVGPPSGPPLEHKFAQTTKTPSF